MPRATTVLTSIVQGGRTPASGTIDSVEWSLGADGFGTITRNPIMTGFINVGDTITDSAANTFLITAIDGLVLTCQDFDTTNDPTTGSFSVQEAYQADQDWEADLDNTILYRSGDDAIGELHSDATFAGDLNINGGGTVGLNSIKLSVIEADRHDGTAGTGARFVHGNNRRLTLAADGIEKTVEWFEWTYSGAFGGNNGSVLIANGATAHRTVSHAIIHDTERAALTTGIRTLEPVDIHNCIIYDIKSTHTGTSGARGIDDGSGGTEPVQINNVTVDRVVNDNGTGAATGIHHSVDNANKEAKNCISMNSGGTTTGTKADYSLSSPSNADYSHNMASDTTASGTGSLDSQTDTDQFVSVTDGSEDYHLKAGASALQAGTDLGTTPTGVNIDIDGTDRDATDLTWDMGADQLSVADIARLLPLMGVGI